MPAWSPACAGSTRPRPCGASRCSSPKRRRAAPSSKKPKTWTSRRSMAAFSKVPAPPAAETPSPPCDAQPEELDIAIAVERIEAATTLQIRRIKNKWAGLRSFVADKNLVVGTDPRVEGFFWLAGQGGYGIQTGEAAGRLAARLALGKALPGDIASLGVSERALSPDRFTQG